MELSMIQVEIWSDVVCPFCYLDKKRFEQALERFPQRDQVEVIWRSFELDPNASRDTDQSIYEVLAAKYRQSVEDARRMTEDVKQQAAELGLEFDFERQMPTNSFDAHRLIQLASETAHQDEMQERLFSAYFVEGKRISDPATLKELAGEAGLDSTRVTQLLSGHEYADQVRAEEANAAQLGISGVPAFVFNRKFLVSGAQPSENFLQALEHAWAQK